VNKYRIASIKVGTEVLHDSHACRSRVFDHIAEQVAAVIYLGIPTIITSSAAVAFAGSYLSRIDGAGLGNWKTMKRSSLAGFGQPELMNEWKRAFEPHRLPVAQLLLTHANMSDQHERFNLADSVSTDYLTRRCVVVVNENDLISHDEMSGIRDGALFSDNDMLAVHVTMMLMTKLGIEGTDIAQFFVTNNRGLYEPSNLQAGERRWLRQIDHATLQDMHESAQEKTTGGRGGGKTKALALMTARRAGIQVGVGSYDEILPFLKGHEIRGTRVGEELSYHDL
jgi:glutamate 5-kinase